MAYEIQQRTEADYRWFRFEAPAELLGPLDHNLKIADGVLRFRIFKVDPDAPVIVPPAAGAPAAAAAPRARRPRPSRSAPGGDAEQGEAPDDLRRVALSAALCGKFLRQGGEIAPVALLDW